MSDLKFSSLWASAIVALTILVFFLNYSGYPGIFPVYKILAWPGIIALRLVSEEMVFLPKFFIMVVVLIVFVFFIVCF